MEPKEAGVVLTAQEIASHRYASSCWIVVDGKAYDVTSYLDEHPGGAAVLLKQGGTVRYLTSSILHVSNVSNMCSASSDTNNGERICRELALVIFRVAC